MKRTDPFPALSVEAELELTLDGHEYRIRDRENRLIVDAPSIPAAMTLFGSLPDADGLGRLLTRSDIAIDLHVRDAVVASTGAGIDGGLGTPTIGGAPTALRPTGLASATAREARDRPIVTAALLAGLLLLVWAVTRARR